MAIVLDASVTACWAFPDELHARADLAFSLMAREEAVVPSLLWFEINERRKGIMETGTTVITDTTTSPLRNVLILLRRARQQAVCSQLPRAHELSVYDAAYLELLAKAAVQAEVPVFGT